FLLGFATRLAFRCRVKNRLKECGHLRVPFLCFLAVAVALTRCRLLLFATVNARLTSSVDFGSRFAWARFLAGRRSGSRLLHHCGIFDEANARDIRAS